MEQEVLENKTLHFHSTHRSSNVSTEICFDWSLVPKNQLVIRLQNYRKLLKKDEIKKMKKILLAVLPKKFSLLSSQERLRLQKSLINSSKGKNLSVLKTHHQILYDNEYLKKCIVFLYNRQTVDEKMSYKTKHQNKIGYNKADAKIMTGYAKKIISGYSLSKIELRMLV